MLTVGLLLALGIAWIYRWSREDTRQAREWIAGLDRRRTGVFEELEVKRG